MAREIMMQQPPQAAPPAYSFQEKQAMAKAVAASRLFPGAESDQAVMVLMMLCEADQLHPIDAMRRYHIIEGRPSMRADAMQAEFQRRGGTVRWVDSNASECHAVFTHPVHAPDGFPVRVALDDLVKAGVATTWNRDKKAVEVKKTYRQFPRQMLRARCISEGVRAVYPGICSGIYTPEEIRDMDEGDPPARPIEVAPAASQADAIGAELVQQLDAPTPREKARQRQEERHPEPRGNTKDRHPSPAEVAADLARHDVRTYQEVISDIVQGADAEWAEAARKMDIEPDPKNPVVNAYQVENHITTWALGEGILKPEHVERDGKRDRKMMVDVLARVHRKNPDRFVGLVASYVAEKLADRKKAAEAVVYGEAEASQEPATPAEDESQDVAEEVHGEGDDRVVIERMEAAHA